MIQNIKLIIGFLVISMLFTGCNSSQKKNDHIEGAPDNVHNESIVTLTAQQAKTIELELVQLEKKNISKGINVTGVLELSPQDKADVSPILGGVVNKLFVFEGDNVKKGEILLTLSNPDFIQLQQDFVTNLHDLKFKEQEFNRQKKLYEEKVGSGREFQRVTSEYRTSKSIVEALKVKLKMLGLNVLRIEQGVIFETMNIVSPIDGSVSLVQTNIGAYIEPLTKVFEIVDNSKVHADFMIYEKDINQVKIGQRIMFTTSSLPNQTLESEVYAISPAFEENPKAVHIHSNILTKNNILTSGMYIQGKLIADNVLTNVLPESAIVSEGEKSFIFIKEEGHEETEENQNHDLEFKQIEVITGFISDGFIEVKLLEKLTKNTKIVGNGAYYLLAEKGKSETEHSH